MRYHGETKKKKKKKAGQGESSRKRFNGLNAHGIEQTPPTLKAASPHLRTHTSACPRVGSSTFGVIQREGARTHAFVCQRGGRGGEQNPLQSFCLSLLKEKK